MQVLLMGYIDGENPLPAATVAELTREWVKLEEIKHTLEDRRLAKVTRQREARGLNATEQRTLANSPTQHEEPIDPEPKSEAA